MRRRVYILAGVLTALLLQAAVPAASQTFADRAAFEAAAGAHIQTIDFEELTDGGMMPAHPFSGGQVRSTNDAANALLVISPEMHSDPALTSRILLSQVNFEPMVVEFDPPVNAVGLDVLTLDPDNSDSVGVVVSVEGSGGAQEFPLPLAAGDRAFFGILTGSETVSRIRVANAPQQLRFVGIDNLSYGSVPPADPGDALLDALERLAAAVAAGQEDGSIGRIAPSLAAKLRAAYAAVVRGQWGVAAGVLQAFKNEVRAASGKRIAPARAGRLLELADECLALLRR